MRPKWVHVQPADMVLTYWVDPVPAVRWRSVDRDRQWFRGFLVANFGREFRLVHA